MGTLIYEQFVTIEFDDRVLAHLQFAIVTRLRLGQGFYLTCPPDSAGQGGRTVVWVNPRSALAFRYDDDTPPAMNRAWVELLVETASTSAGLRVVPEPVSPPHGGGSAPSRRGR